MVCKPLQVVLFALKQSYLTLDNLYKRDKESVYSLLVLLKHARIVDSEAWSKMKMTFKTFIIWRKLYNVAFVTMRICLWIAHWNYYVFSEVDMWKHHTRRVVCKSPSKSKSWLMRQNVVRTISTGLLAYNLFLIIVQILSWVFRSFSSSLTTWKKWKLRGIVFKVQIFECGKSVQVGKSQLETTQFRVIKMWAWSSL